MQNLVDRLEGVRYLFVVGRGPSLAAVGSGALIVKEADHFRADGMSSAAFRHGPIEMLNKETLVLIFSGQGKSGELNRRLFDDIRQFGGRADLVGEESAQKCFRIPDGSASGQAILEILPVQMITLALAGMAGREPGKFERATKITTTE
jgi:glucosamine--fructose-6-phosphate aminotransferase (isomerizing)